MVVEPRYNGGDRAVAVDLVDSQPPIACNDLLPCTPQFNLGFVTPDVHCSVMGTDTMGTCNDPLLTTPPGMGVPLFVPVGSPATGDAGSGTAIRIVFNKVLDNGIEVIMPAKDAMGNPVTTPGKTLVYDLMPTVAKLVDPTNMEVPSKKILDNGGSPTFTSDLILAPLGPAIVIKPKASLAPLTKYTIQLDGSQIKDRQGNLGADQNGNPLGSYSLAFTTENVTLQTAATAPNGSLTYPEFTAPPVKITPNEVIQLNFWTTVQDPQMAGSMTTVTVTGPGGAITVEAYLDAGGDPTMCSANVNPNQLDIAHVSAPGMPTDWPAGDYMMMVTATSDMNPNAAYKKTLMFTVAGTDGTDAADPNTVGNHPVPEQCTG